MGRRRFTGSALSPSVFVIRQWFAGSSEQAFKVALLTRLKTVFTSASTVARGWKQILAVVTINCGNGEREEDWPE